MHGGTWKLFFKYTGSIHFLYGFSLPEKNWNSEMHLKFVQRKNDYRRVFQHDETTADNRLSLQVMFGNTVGLLSFII